MRIIFWLAVGFVAYAYAGYPFWLYLRSRWWPRKVLAGDLQVPVSIVMAVRNEEKNLVTKLANLRALDYPAALCEWVVISDGSTDATNALLAREPGQQLHTILLPEAQGKAVALNHGMRAAQGEIVVFTDARQRLEPQSVRRLVNCFADPSVGAVSGELILDGEGGLGVYWRLEKKIRQWESASGSAVGVTGAIYAVRRRLLRPLPPGTILDDVYVPMQVVRQGQRVLFEPSARAHDQLADDQHEFRRKVRTLTGNYQLLQLAPWLLTPANPLWFEFLAHKLLRLLVPFALTAMLVASALAPGPFYNRLALVLQLAFYALASLARFRRRLGWLGRLAAVSHSFVLLNTAALLAFFNFATGRRTVWIR